MAKTSNIFDPIQKGLDQKVFSGITPRPRIVKFILDEMHKVLTPLVGFDPLPYMSLYLTGSLTTYQYDKTSDCDVSVFIDWGNWPTGEDPNLIRRKLIPIVMDKLDGTMLPGTTHPIQHFVVPPGVEPSDLYKPGLRSAWSFSDHVWLVPPEKDRVHDISVELPVLYHRAQDMADKMDNLLAYDPIYAKEFWHQIHRKRQMDQKAGLGDFSEGNIVYKYLLHNGYFDRIRDELGEKISKVAMPTDQPFLDGLRYEWKDDVGLPNPGEYSGLLVAYDGNYLAGLIQIDNGAIWQLDVKPRYRRKGLATKLYQLATERFEELQHRDLTGPGKKWLEAVEPGQHEFEREDGYWQVAKIAADEYIPPIGSIWTMSNPWAGATPEQRNESPRKTIEVIDADDDVIWYRNVDKGTEQIIRVPTWNQYMWAGRIWKHNDQDWKLQQSPEEASDLWPDTLPENWSMVREAETQRLFLAYELPPEIVQQVIEWQQANLPEGVHPEPDTNLHMTIAFLGDTDTSMIPALQQILTEIDPSQVVLTGPVEYRELEKLAFLALEDNGGNEVVEQINEKLKQLMGYEPQFRPWLPHITVWRFAPENKPNLQPQLPNFGSFTPQGVHVFTSVKNPAGGGIYQKVAWTPVVIEGEGIPEFHQGESVRHRTDPYRSHGYVGPLQDDGTYLVQWYPMDTDVEYHRPEDLVSLHNKPKPELVSKTADDLSWVDKSTPYGTPPGGFIGGPEHWGDDSIDLPSEPSRDLEPPDNQQVQDPKGSLKVIYDFERDQIILGDVRKAEQFPPGQIIGDYRDPDVYLNDHAEAWFNAGYFKRLWQHSFPKRPIRHVILDKGNGQHEVVHHEQ